MHLALRPACLWREAKFSQARRREKGDRELPCGTQNAQQSGSLEVSRPGEHGMAQVAGASCPRAAPGQPFVFKLVLLGSGSVGKSSLALRYVKNDFRSTLPTVGCAFFTKVVDLGAASLKLEIWDTAGQEKYHSVCHLYFRGANAALLVYDITRKDSFDMVQQWLKDLEKEFHPGEIVVMLVGNKTDLGEEREVTFEEGKEFAESKRLLFMETSARLNHQVTEVFSAVARELLQREERKEGQTQRRDARLALNERPAGQAKCCAR
uniref:Ras-related protein Rab-17 n=1 Tax=Equus caballus TaxID=9796 RepID=A0A9L0SA01_HORSE